MPTPPSPSAAYLWPDLTSPEDQHSGEGGGIEGEREGGREMEGWRDGGMEGWREGGMEGEREWVGIVSNLFLEEEYM